MDPIQNKNNVAAASGITFRPFLLILKVKEPRYKEHWGTQTFPPGKIY